MPIKYSGSSVVERSPSVWKVLGSNPGQGRFTISLKNLNPRAFKITRFSNILYRPDGVVVSTLGN